MRLQKFLALCGVASRRKAEEIIASGRVSVNGRVVTQMGAEAAIGDEVLLDGTPISPVSERVYILFYKPRGVVSTVSDPQGRRTVLSYMPAHLPRVYPVGRLDYDTEGALLLTNDGALAFRLTHPRYEIQKIYRARVWGYLSEQTRERLETGVELDGRMTAPSKVGVLRKFNSETTLNIALHEGRNRQVRRMLEAVGHRVLSLERLKVGDIDLSGLMPGQWRHLNPQEVAGLLRICELPDAGVENP